MWVSFFKCCPWRQTKSKKNNKSILKMVKCILNGYWLNPMVQFFRDFPPMSFGIPIYKISSWTIWDRNFDMIYKNAFWLHSGTEKVVSIFFTWPAIRYCLWVNSEKEIKIFAKNKRTRYIVYKEIQIKMFPLFCEFILESHFSIRRRLLKYIRKLLHQNNLVFYLFFSFFFFIFFFFFLVGIMQYIVK